MKCPFCASEDTQVVDTRANLEANTVRRRRKCLNCEKRFTTYERVDLKMPRLVKKDGSRTDFDRDKITGSMMLALRKRPVATGALELAEKGGLYTTTPNPRVGCVIAKDEKIVAEGWHEKAGGPHAEIVALEKAGAAAAGATLYVNLEPCNHHGRTPPCSQALIE